LDELFTTLQATLGEVHATNFSRFSLMLPVFVQTDPKFTHFVDDLKQLFMRSEKGEMVPFEKLLTIRKTVVPSAVVRVEGRRAVIVTAAPAAGKTPLEASVVCGKLVLKVLPKGYDVKFLTRLPR
jgi:multidrug efflux pump subunit AcrB